MCLATLNPKLTPCRVGYKVFRKPSWRFKELNPDALFGQCQGQKKRPIGKWLDEKAYRPSLLRVRTHLYIRRDAIRIAHYPTGWHVFHTRAGAKAWGVRKDEVIRKVLVRGSVAVGYQQCGLWTCANASLRRVTVCKEIFILPEGAKNDS